MMSDEIAVLTVSYITRMSSHRYRQLLASIQKNFGL